MQRHYLFIPLLFVAFLSSMSYATAQSSALARQSTGSCSSEQLNHKTVAQQSIGQASPIGSFSSSTLGARQGILQPIASGTVKQDATAIEYSVYPNPFTDLVNIELVDALADETIVEIYTMQGQLVSSTTLFPSENATIDLSHLSAGTYALVLGSTSKSTTLIQKL